MAEEKDFWFIRLLHRFPHINFSFQQTNSTFDPNSSSYRESILFLSALPVLFILLIILLSACCLCVLCVRKRPQKAVKTTCLRIFAAIFIIFTVGSAAVGFFANEHTNSGVKSFEATVKDANRTLENTLRTLFILDTQSNNVAVIGVQKIQAIINNKVLNSTAKTILTDILGQIVDETGNSQRVIDQIREQISDYDLEFILSKATEMEFYRWCGTIVLLSFVLFLMILAIVGCYKKSRCFLLMSTCIGFLVLLLVWAASGAYLGLAVAGGDLCSNPSGYLESFGRSAVQEDVIKAYIECKGGNGLPRNFSTNIKDANKTVEQANSTLNRLFNKILPLNLERELQEPVEYIRGQLNYALGNITTLSKLLDCKTFHTDYKKVENSVCETTLIGVVLLLLVIPFMGICMVFIQCLLPRIWHLSGKRRGYRPVDDTDPFTPRPPPYNGYGSVHDARNSPADYYHERTHMDNDQDSLETLPMRGPLSDSPPPAYHPGSFQRHYNYNTRESTEA